MVRVKICGITSLEDARAYVDFHLKRAECSPELFTEGAVMWLFNISQGVPRCFNQAAVQALIQAATCRKEKIDENFLQKQVAGNLLLEDFEEEDR